MNTGNQKSSTKHEKHDMITKTECTTQSTISESNSSSYQSEKKAGKSFDASKSNINGSESTDIKESQISSEMNIGTQKTSTKSEKHEKTIETETSMQSKISESSSTTMTEKKTTSQMLQKGISIESSESNE